MSGTVHLPGVDGPLLGCAGECTTGSGGFPAPFPRAVLVRTRAGRSGFFDVSVILYFVVKILVLSGSWWPAFVRENFSNKFVE